MIEAQRIALAQLKNAIARVEEAFAPPAQIQRRFGVTITPGNGVINPTAVNTPKNTGVAGGMNGMGEDGNQR